MKIAEDYIPEDNNTGLSSDDPLLSSNDDQEQVYDLDESISLLNDEAEVSMLAETSLDKEKDDNSILEELEALYGSSDEVRIDDPESVYDDSVLHELEVVYDSTNESISDKNEIVSNIEEPISENKSTGDSVLEELEAMFSGDSVESVMDSITDNVETSEAVEHSSNESETSGLSALDELKAFLGETASNEDSESDNKYAANDEYLLESRRSVLDELKNLLQSCIDELTATTEDSSAFSILSAEVEYPDCDELINLLETKLSQLMKISADSASSDYVAGGASVLDELSGLLSETEIDNNKNVSDTSVSPGEVNEYVSSIELDHDSYKDETVATDSVLDELKELLGETDDAEIAESPSTGDYSIAEVSYETPVLEDSTVSAADTGGNEKSVLEEFAAYMDGSSDLPGVGIEAPEQETETASAFDESDTLKQLEAMLNESS
ncbi:MAG: hypothetical protein GQ546_09285, partial [Gammaproteobacteria bacterium]|nr:hypothetical protein [Gammaproteobacteria bacterium]